MLRINRLSAALAALLCLAPSLPAAASNHHLPHYRLVDVGSFGGTFGVFNGPSTVVVNRHGTAAGASATAVPDPSAPNCFFNCQVAHAFVWKDGVTTDLGALSASASSFPNWINDLGLVAGVSQNGAIDPLTGIPDTHGVLWRNGGIFDLGTLGGNNSTANAINSWGVIAGASLTADPDPFVNVPMSACRILPSNQACWDADFASNAFVGPAATQTQTHAVLWFHGRMVDLGTLGGPDSTVVAINDRSQVVGWSYTSYTANASGVPTLAPFLWENGRMTNLGSLGGTSGAAWFVNQRGQVIGASNLAGDAALTAHAFLWSRSTGMRDLGTLGGTLSVPNWLNEAGDVVGDSFIADNPPGHHVVRAFYWHNGHMSNLGTLGTDESSGANSINNAGLIVGDTFIRKIDGGPLRTFLSDRGGPLVDLNTLVRAGPSIYVIDAVEINDKGEIVGEGRLPNGDLHPIVLVPMDGD